MKNLSVTFRTPRGEVHAVRELDLSLPEGVTLGLVGERGCGKSTLGRAILRILQENATMTGSIRFGAMDLLSLAPKATREIRGRNISMIFQDPMTRLNPLMRVRDHFLETIRAHEPDTSKEAALARARKVLRAVRVPPDRMAMYPHELSGGMRQRIMIAIALLFNPILLIADEPTTALDVIVEAQILELLRSIMKDYNMAVLLITHNLGLVAEFADRVAVMYAGRIVEEGETHRVFRKPMHPYTQGLLKSVIDLDTKDLYSIPGYPPSLLGKSVGCPFYPRCEQHLDICKTVDPPLRSTGDDRGTTLCHLY